MQTRRLIKVTAVVIVVGIVGGLSPAWGVNNWIQLDDGVTMESVTSLAAHGFRIYAGSDNGVFVSEDGGNSWSPTSFNNPVSTLTVDRDTIYVGTWVQGVFRSDDAGMTWKPIRDGLGFHEFQDGTRYYGDVRRLLITENNIINVMYHRGTYTSTDRGETWHDISAEWFLGDSIYSMTEFDGYLWSAISVGSMLRSPDNGKTWEELRPFDYGRVNDWAVLNGRLVVAGQAGVGVWNENTQDWEYPMVGLPIGHPGRPNDPPHVSTFSIHEGRLFAGLRTHGVYVLDVQSKTWSSIGLEGTSVYSLLSHGSGLYAGTTENGIYYLAKVRTISPQEGSVEGGEPITVFGGDFPVGTTVAIGRKLVTNLQVTNTLITGLTPPGIVGEADIEVRVPNSGILIVERRKFLYTNTPSIPLAMTPTHGLSIGGGTGILTGSTFTPDTAVKIGDNPATDVVVTPALIYFTIPPGTVGTVAVTVTTPDGREWILENGYTYDPFPPPVIREIYPNEGPIDGGTEVVISGNNFRDGSVVFIGGIQVEQLDSLSPTEIRLKTLPLPFGHKDIRVVNPDGQQVVQTRAFTYNAPLNITSITPNVGPTKGGTSVTIAGTGFRVGNWSTRVTIGGVIVSAVTDMSLTELIVKTPEVTTPGAKDVVLRNPNGEEVTLIDGFTYDASLAVEPKGKLLTSLGHVKQTRLLQNYPNPFNPETWIPYQLATEADVTVVIYDSGGQLVRTFELGSQPSGLYLTQERAAYWDGQSDTGEWVSSGTYFYHLQAGGYSAAKKMIILK